MKRFLSILLIVCALVPLGACGRPNEQYVVPTSTVAPTPKPTPRPVDGLKDDGFIHVYLIGDCEKIATPESSWINSIAYYPECDHLLVCSDNGDYVHANVSQAIWNEFKNAESKGTYYANNFKGAGEYWITDYDGSNGNLIVMEKIN